MDNNNCCNNSIIWTVLLLLIFFRCKTVDTSSMNFDDFFRVSNVDPLLSGLIL